jgi:hypothetical protein
MGSSLAGRPLTLTESHDFAEVRSLSQLSFNPKKSLCVAAEQRLSCHGVGAKMPPSGPADRPFSTPNGLVQICSAIATQRNYSANCQFKVVTLG